MYVKMCGGGGLKAGKTRQYEVSKDRRCIELFNSKLKQRLGSLGPYELIEDTSEEFYEQEFSNLL